MKINEEMIKMSLNNKCICTIYDDNYVLLRKRMPVTDDKLSWYVETIKKLKDMGVNIATIVDYVLLPDRKKSYRNGEVQYTEGVFLEDRANGISFGSESMYLDPKRNYDFYEVVQKYLKLMIGYIEELESRANAPQFVYDKLISDCKMISSMGMRIDPKPLNFFFDSSVGYTIIDVISSSSKEKDLSQQFFPSYMFTIIFGYGMPSLSVDFTKIGVIPEELKQRLIKAGEILEAKIVSSLRKFGFTDDVIANEVEKNRFRYRMSLPSVELEDIENYVAQQLMLKREESLKKENEDLTDDIIILGFN